MAWILRNFHTSRMNERTISSYSLDVYGIFSIPRPLFISLLRFFPIVLQEVPSARLLIVGADPPRAVQRLANLPNIEVIGYVPRIHSYLSKATIAVSPAQIGTYPKQSIGSHGVRHASGGDIPCLERYRS